MVYLWFIVGKEAATKPREMNQSSIESVKSTIVLYIRDKYQDKYRELALTVVLSVKHELEGSFAADVAETVAKTKRASEKQAYVIARAFVESCPKIMNSALVSN